jgi:glutaredoxin
MANGIGSMKPASRTLLTATALLGCLAIGLWSGPKLRDLYYSMFPASAYETGDFSEVRRMTSKPVILFSTSTCPYCGLARDFLDSRGIPYLDLVIDLDEDAARNYELIEGQGVPTFIIGDRKILGFNTPVLVEALRRAGVGQTPPSPP